jgi:hypothetical protein
MSKYPTFECGHPINQTFLNSLAKKLNEESKSIYWEMAHHRDGNAGPALT